MAVAVGAKYVREIFSGVYASDFGLWNTNCGEVIRHKFSIGAEDVRLFFNIVPEAAVYLAGRDVSDIARSTVFNHKPDALCVSGLTAGVKTDVEIIEKVKKAVPTAIVFANTGVNIDNFETQLEVADGAILATSLKVDGIFENPIDKNRVTEFMKKVRSFRENKQ